MTKLTKKVERVTGGVIFERSQQRPVIVSIEPPNILGFRLLGTRKTYRLTAEACWWAAMQADLEREKRDLKRAIRKRNGR